MKRVSWLTLWGLVALAACASAVSVAERRRGPFDALVAKAKSLQAKVEPVVQRGQAAAPQAQKLGAEAKDLGASGKSLFDQGKALVQGFNSGGPDFISRVKTFADKAKPLVEQGKNLVDKGKNLFNEGKALVQQVLHGTPAAPGPVAVTPVTPTRGRGGRRRRRRRAATPMQKAAELADAPDDGPCPNCAPEGGFSVKSAPGGLRTLAKTIAGVIEQAGAIPASVDRPKDPDPDQLREDTLKGYLHDILARNQMAKLATGESTTVDYVTLQDTWSKSEKKQNAAYLKIHGKLRPLSVIKEEHDRLQLQK